MKEPPSYVVLREVGKGRWELVGEVPRRPGLTARAARAQAVSDATGGKAGKYGPSGGIYVAYALPRGRSK